MLVGRGIEGRSMAVTFFLIDQGLSSKPLMQVEYEDERVSVLKKEMTREELT